MFLMSSICNSKLACIITAGTAYLLYNLVNTEYKMCIERVKANVPLSFESLNNINGIVALTQKTINARDLEKECFEGVADTVKLFCVVSCIALVVFSIYLRRR
jgi:hypothetical protein